MEEIKHIISKYLSTFHIPTLRITDIVEILLITFLVYKIMVWTKNTKAWELIKGVIVILVFLLIAALFNMDTIIWIASNIFGLAVTAIIVVLQPELRRALETIGKKNLVSAILPFDNRAEEGIFSDKTIREIVRAVNEMSKVKTGALIAVGQLDPLLEYEQTGIAIDSILSSQLLINIFEHNTPLHDGAVIVKGNRIVSATCYLPLSDNALLSKDLGTRHRAGVGLSEITDAMVIIVSEETGKLSVAYQGRLTRGIKSDELNRMLASIQNKPQLEKGMNWFKKSSKR